MKNFVIDRTIAEILGWKSVQLDNDNTVLIGMTPGNLSWIYVPKFYSDLNAMHQVEADYVIPNGLWDEYVANLKASMCQGDLSAGERFWGHANAPQRAKAFLITLGKWREPQPTPDTP